MNTKYKHAIVKFNNGNGALLCNTCRVIMEYGFDHEDTEHRCGQCLAKLTKNETDNG